jgi:8-hydroxy-5-deazaflavin:NADPH oxidoreductase
MRIGIIGSGRIGATVAKLLTRAGHDVAIANSRGPDSLAGIGQDTGAQPATVDDAAGFGELVLVAIPLRAIGDLAADGFAGKVVLDANNYYPGRDGRIDRIESGEITSSELLAEHLDGARVVKAFNTMFYETLASEGRPGAPREQRLALFISADDGDAKRRVADLIEEIGFAAIDTGPLGEGGRRQQPGAPLYNVTMTATEAERALEST